MSLTTPAIKLTTAFLLTLSSGGVIFSAGVVRAYFHRLPTEYIVQGFPQGAFTALVLFGVIGLLVGSLLCQYATLDLLSAARRRSSQPDPTGRRRAPR